MSTQHSGSRRPLTLAISLALAVSTVHGATITVNTSADTDPSASNTCTLRQAVETANGGTSNNGNCAAADNGADTIKFAANLYGSTITLTDKLGVIQPLTIQGSNQTIIGPTASYAFFDSSSLTASSLTISGTTHTTGAGGAFRVSHGTLALDHVTISDNTASFGGGISASNSTLNLTNTTISGNSASAQFPTGGGLNLSSCMVTLTNSVVSGNSAGNGSTNGTGGGIYASRTTLDVTNTPISHNTASFAGGGIVAIGAGTSLTLANSPVTYNSVSNYSSGRKGGGLYIGSYATASLTASTVSHNTGFSGGGIAAFYHADVTLTDTTVSENIPSYSGGGLNVSNNSTASLINSTFSLNVAHAGGAIAGFSSSTISLVDSTVSANSASTGGGVNLNLSASLSISNTILSGNSASTNPDVAVLNSSSFSAYSSLLGSGASPGIHQNNIYADNPGLYSLNNNGGPTQTMALKSNSPAIDTGNNGNIAPGVSNDQRGTGFPRVFNARVDIGAFEFNDTIFANSFELIL